MAQGIDLVSVGYYCHCYYDEYIQYSLVSSTLNCHRFSLNEVDFYFELDHK